MIIKPKKYLGQHFLKDKEIAKQIVGSLQADGISDVLEIGAGTGILTGFLLKRNFNTYIVEIDKLSVDYLKTCFPELKDRIYCKDFLKLDFKKYFPEQTAIIGNFPYNISSQILFKMLEYKQFIPELVGMFQEEVALRIDASPGSKTYGILSVLVQAFYYTEYLLSVNPEVFLPPPKVQSAVIRLVKKEKKNIDCNEKLFFKVVKTAFNQRRKMLRNSLKVLLKDKKINDHIMTKRPEQLNVNDFVFLTNMIEIDKE